MDVSIAMPVFDRPEHLKQVLASIRRQRTGRLTYEIIVVNDGSNDEIRSVCSTYKVDTYLETGNNRRRSPAHAWNKAYQAAKADIILSQASDVLHASKHLIVRSHAMAIPGRYIVGTVFNVIGQERWITAVISAPDAIRSNSGCLQIIWRRDIYTIGGLEKTLPEMGYDEHFRAKCLQSHGVMPLFTSQLVGYHLDHPHSLDHKERVALSREAMRRRMRECRIAHIPYTATGGPWEINH